MDKDIRFTKIKLVGDPQKLRLEWLQRNGSKWDEYSFTSNDEPHPDFFEQLQSLIDHVIDICELPNDESEHIKHEIKGVSYSFTNDVMGATITSLRRLGNSNAPLVINTPHKVEDFYSETGDEKQLLPDNAIIDLYALQREAKAFLDGKRSQGDLFTNEFHEKVPGVTKAEYAPLHKVTNIGINTES